MSQIGFRIQDLPDRPVKRPDMPCEWLTKISFKEFQKWAQAQADLVRFRGVKDRDVINEHIEEEIQREEQLYQALKTVGNNGLKKSTKTFDLVSTPSNRDAVWTGNGRIHRVDKYEALTAKTMTAVEMIEQAEYDIKTRYKRYKKDGNMLYDPESLAGEKFVYHEDWKESYVTYSF